MMHRRHFLMSTVLNARRIEAVVGHLLEAGIEEAREAGDPEALSRLSVMKNKQYERQLERSERLSALRSILTRSTEERRSDKEEKRVREEAAIEEATRQLAGGGSEGRASREQETEQEPQGYNSWEKSALDVQAKNSDSGLSSRRSSFDG